MAVLFAIAPYSELEIVRTAYLRIYGDEGLIIESALEPTDVVKEGQDHISYWFRIARKNIRYSTMAIDGSFDYKDVERRSIPIGGTLFEFSLADFAVD